MQSVFPLRKLVEIEIYLSTKPLSLSPASRLLLDLASRLTEGRSGSACYVGSCFYQQVNHSQQEYTVPIKEWGKRKCHQWQCWCRIQQEPTPWLSSPGCAARLRVHRHVGLHYESSEALDGLARLSKLGADRPLRSRSDELFAKPNVMLDRRR
jgi:hypothetical protein